MKSRARTHDAARRRLLLGATATPALAVSRSPGSPGSLGSLVSLALPLVAGPRQALAQEAGYRRVLAVVGVVRCRPATPAPIVDRLRQAARQAAEDPRVIQSIGTAGTPILYQDAPQFARFVADDAKAMAGVVNRIGKQ